MKEKPREEDPAREEDPEIVKSIQVPPLSPEQQQRVAEMVERDEAVEADCAERLRLGIS